MNDVDAFAANTSRKRQIHVADRLVDLLRVFESDRRGIDSCALESEPHCFHAIVMTLLELTASTKLHADHSQPFLFQRVDVIDHFAYVGWVVGVLIGRPVHTCAVVIDADQSYVEPVGAGHLA